MSPNRLTASQCITSIIERFHINFMHLTKMNISIAYLDYLQQNALPHNGNNECVFVLCEWLRSGPDSHRNRCILSLIFTIFDYSILEMKCGFDRIDRMAISVQKGCVRVYARV